MDSIHITIERDGEGGDWYGARVAGSDPEIGASPDEALGSAVRQLYLAGALDGPVFLVLHLLEE